MEQEEQAEVGEVGEVGEAPGPTFPQYRALADYSALTSRCLKTHKNTILASRNKSTKPLLTKFPQKGCNKNLLNAYIHRPLFVHFYRTSLQRKYMKIHKNKI